MKKRKEEQKKVLITQFIYQLSVEEKQMLKTKAHKREMSMSEYLRWLVENDEV